MENPGPYLTSPQGNTAFTQESPNDYGDTGLPGPSADVDQGQSVTITQQEINERERRRIIEGCGLASSDEDNKSEKVQPQTGTPEAVDSWRTKFSRYQPDHNYSTAAIGHTPVCTLTD